MINNLITGEVFLHDDLGGIVDISTFGVMLSETAMSLLVCPPPVKSLVENKSALEGGKRVIHPKDKYGNYIAHFDERDISLEIFIFANNLDDMYERLIAFTSKLVSAPIVMTTSHQPNVYYRMEYNSCPQFSDFNGRLGKFTLKLNEPNPENRGATDINDQEDE